eukprot:CAMPEP_0179059798 /NCGR_PEP_ID=MMETSP0796-20121207/25539_1 /TAXON_ID=73915 /ORGANISM="Pyrodinium bahamense, Strain pbaha01" /LENGTH=150 /DNA_ID=CAMNT_0020756567 /DNA_START=61 /DNA_END=513 /DNA_ORIENTATION=+
MAVNAGYVVESAVIPGTLDDIWKTISPMTFKFSKSVSQATKADDGSQGHLGTYSICYTDNTVQVLRVTEISERLPNTRSIGMEYISSDPGMSYAARMDQIVLKAITHSDKPMTYVEFSSDFSSDASMEVLEDSKFKKREFFNDLSAFISG